jgi:outer membrane biosynthesis protein TonB
VGRGVAISQAPPERQEFRRLLAVSAAAHLLLGFLLAWSRDGEVMVPQGVIAVELVAPPSAAPAPAPKAAARPAPPPPPPKPEKIVLPKETAPPKPQPKAEAKPEPKPVPEAEPAPEKDLSDVLSELRAEAGDEAPAAEPAPAQTAAIGSPTGQPVSPEFLAWERKARIHIRQSWVVPPSFRNQPLRTGIVVELSASGEVVGEPQVVKRSGNPWYDDGVVRSIQKASPLPPPPEPGEWSFVFVADESF